MGKEIIIMKKRIVLGLLFSIIFELIVGFIFFLLLNNKSTSTVYILDVIKIVIAALFLFIVQTIVHLFMVKIGGDRFHQVLHVFFILGIVAFVFCIIYSFTDIFAVTGLLFLGPILISCIVWW